MVNFILFCALPHTKPCGFMLFFSRFSPTSAYNVIKKKESLYGIYIQTEVGKKKIFDLKQPVKGGGDGS